MSFSDKLKKVFRAPGKIPMNILYRLPFIANRMSDEKYLKFIFRFAMGKKLNLENPRSFSEKQQWLKIYDRRPEYTTMVDKYEAKLYVAEKIGGEYIVPTLGVWDKFDDIDFDSLPERFVLKCTHDSGGLVICRDKSKLDIQSARKKIEHSLKTEFFYVGREWPYKNVKPRIIAEKYLEDADNADMIDYKFYCFNGVPKFLYVSQGLENHATAHISYVTMDWEIAPFRRTDYANFEQLPPCPRCFEKMKEFAGILSKDIPFSRIDFYDINGKLYFGEITFFPGSGLSPFEPKEWDEKIGGWIKLPEKTV